MKTNTILIKLPDIPAVFLTACVELDQVLVLQKPKCIAQHEATHRDSQLTCLIAKVGQCTNSALPDVEVWLPHAKVQHHSDSASIVNGFSSTESQSWTKHNFHQNEYEQRLHAPQ